MNVKFKDVLDYQGKIAQTQDIKDDKLVMRDLTMKEVLINALNYRGEKQSESPADAMKIWAVSMRIEEAYASGKESVDIDIDDIKRIKDNLPKAYKPVVAGQVISYLEGLKVTEEEKKDGESRKSGK